METKKALSATEPSSPITEPPAPEPNPGNIAAAAPDPFDLDSLRVDESYLESMAAKKLLLTVPVRKPGPQDFCHVHPNENYRGNFLIIELRDEKEIYLVPPRNVSAFALSEEVFQVTLFTTINTKGVVATDDTTNFTKARRS